MDLVRAAATHRWPEVLAHVAGIPEDYLDGKHHGCSRCGGIDRFRFFNDGTGGALCNQCNRRMGDGFAVIQHYCGVDFLESVERAAVYLNVPPLEPGRDGKPKNRRGSQGSKSKPQNPAEHLAWMPENEQSDIQLAHWCMKKPPITVAALKMCGARLAKYRRSWMVVALPIWGEQLAAAAPVGYCLYNVTGGTLPVWMGKGKPPEWVKVKTTAGSKAGVIGAVEKLKELRGAQ